jgi:site-specific DNA recombinase
VVNEDEAHRVRQIFERYLGHEALLPVVRELAERGWANKRWTTKAGAERGGRPFDKTTLYHLLTNRTYTGVVQYQGQVFPGEHVAIVEPSVFERVKAVLARNGQTAGASVRNRYGALLKGLLRCACCRCAMVHSYSVKPNDDDVAYWAQQRSRGWDRRFGT